LVFYKRFRLKKNKKNKVNMLKSGQNDKGSDEDRASSKHSTRKSTRNKKKKKRSHLDSDDFDHDSGNSDSDNDDQNGQAPGEREEGKSQAYES